MPPCSPFRFSPKPNIPTKPLRAVVAFGTGGTTDVTARIIAAAMSQSLGQTVVIDNRPGADGIIAGSEVVKSAPDGYTILFATYTQISALPSLRKNVPFDPLADFTPIGGIGNFGFFWAVNPELPMKSLKELAEYGRANPGKLNAGSSGAAATIAPTMFARAEKFDLQVVALQERDHGAQRPRHRPHPARCSRAERSRQHVRDGRARGLATLDNQRSKTLPDLPTMAEAGVAPFPAVPWMGLFGPAKMPKEVVERLSRELLGVAQESRRARAGRASGHGPQSPLRRSDRRARERADRNLAARHARGRLHGPRVTTRVVSRQIRPRRAGRRAGPAEGPLRLRRRLDASRPSRATRPRPAQEVIRYEHGLVMPGFVNLHAHCIRGGLFRGIPDDLEMEPFVPKLVYNILLPLTALAAKELTAEELRAVTALGMIDLLKGGTTTLLDMWHHGQDVFFDVARELGLRTVGAPFIMSASNSRLGPDGYPVWDFGNDGHAQLQKSIALFKARDEGHEGLAQVAIGPHATDTCLPELLRECRKAADDLGCILTTHFAQTPQELALLRKRYGMGAAEYARHAGLLGRNVVLAHAGCATDDGAEAFSPKPAPASPIAPSASRARASTSLTRASPRAGINTGIGTDSHGMDFISEMRITGLLSKQHFGKAHVGTARELVRAGTLAGAEALGRPDLGRLAPGARADLLVYDLWKPHLQPVRDPSRTSSGKATPATSRSSWSTASPSCGTAATSRPTRPPSCAPRPWRRGKSGTSRSSDRSFPPRPELTGTRNVHSSNLDDRPYGMRDFEVIDPSGNHLAFGEPKEG